VGRHLQRERFEFVTVTPATHRRVNERARANGQVRASTLRDVFGWNRPFEPALLAPELMTLLMAADAVSESNEGLRSRVRFSTLRGRLFAHSAFPTDDVNAVFFGPDSYRFCSLLERFVRPGRRRLVDVGCGSGVGGITVSGAAEQLVLADVNPQVMAFVRVNAALAATQAELVVSDVLQNVSGTIDVIVANPPYLRDERTRLYRDGGGTHGEAVGTRIVHEALDRLSAGGQLVLYTGSAIEHGVDTFYRAVAPLLRSEALEVHYEELDPDVFGEELDNPSYSATERIAAVALVVTVR
jgi:hypothetical protein